MDLLGQRSPRRGIHLEGKEAQWPRKRQLRKQPKAAKGNRPVGMIDISVSAVAGRSEVFLRTATDLKPAAGIGATGVGGNHDVCHKHLRDVHPRTEPRAKAACCYRDAAAT